MGPDINELEALPELPPADFDFLIYSLRLQTELSLGLLLLGPPGEDQTGLDFDQARHNIDLLAMLQQKTKGNLTDEEQKALDNSVTNLRFHFTQVQQEALNLA
jgi:hypothetical protein